MVELSASILSVEKEKAIKTFYNLEEAKIDYFHIDVMDGKFVKEDTSILMKEYTEYLKQITNLPLDVHLMVEDVKSYLISYSALEPSNITFHLEAGKNKEEIMEWINYIKQEGIKVGISIKPDTKVEEIKPYLQYINLCLVMSVEPGYGGQEFIEAVIPKIQELNRYREEQSLDYIIEVDGGINQETVAKVKDAGADIITVGSYLVKSENYKETVKNLKV